MQQDLPMTPNLCWLSTPFQASDSLKRPLLTGETEDASEKVAEKKRNIIPESVKEQIRKGLDLFADYIQTQRRNSREHGKAHLTDLDDVDYPHWFIPFTHIAWLTGMRPGDIRNMRWENHSPQTDSTGKHC